MDVSGNFTFLAQEFPHAAESASFAERHIRGDPRASCFHARHALEGLVKRVFRVDKALSPPKTTNLDGYLSDPGFLALVPEAVAQKAEFIRKQGNVAVHGNRPPTPEEALAVVRELAHVLYWAGRTYLRKGAEQLRELIYNESLVPSGEPTTSPATLEELRAAVARQEATEEANRELASELEALREKLAAIKAENAKIEETHDYNEAATRLRLIDVDLKRAGWQLNRDCAAEVSVKGLPTASGVGFVDYVLWGDDGKPLGLVEAKRLMADPKKGQQQAKLYADCLEASHGQRPVIFLSNGYDTRIWDDLSYPPRQVAGYYAKEELQRLIIRRSQKQTLDVAKVDADIAGRPYQKRAIGSIGEHFAARHRKALLVMATGTGKTRTAIALVDLLQRAGWVKRALFLADRTALVRQAVNAFKKNLPESSPVNLVTEKHKEGRVYACTYPTMMGLIDETKGVGPAGEARFGVGHFDLVVIDEAHRSVYQKYGAIFEHFDSLLVGLTATPREEVDKNTYNLFGLEAGSPTDAYELGTAVAEGYLVPPAVSQVNLRFPKDGIDYDDLTDEEKAQWEELDWGDDVDPDALPDKVNASAINRWLFNKDTADKVLQHLMENGHRVDGGDRLAKTIVFARNHAHAAFIEERFNHHHPHLKGHFARVIDNQASHAQSLIDDFSVKESDPHIAISVDMLDTGIDVPEVANLVFFKPVYSKIKFWQMIGRGTRLCPDLFGPGDDKADFRVFDFCFNFDFFHENPNGIETGAALPLGARLFRNRVDLLTRVQATPDLDESGELAGSLANGLHAEVAAMNRENFTVRLRREAVDRFRDRGAWDKLSEADRAILNEDVSRLPSEQETDHVESRRFDLAVLTLQLAHAEGDPAAGENARQRILAIAGMLEEKDAIPAVRAQLEYLQRVQTNEFWEGIHLALLEDLRMRLRGLVPFLDKKQRNVVYTDFKDEVMEVRETKVVNLPRMTSLQYEKKVRAYLDEHRNHIAIARLRTNQPLTAADLTGLEQTLVAIGEGVGEELLAELLTRSEAPSLSHFVRTLVGLDRAAVQEAFGRYLGDRSLTPPQIRFIEMVVEQLTSRGVMEAGALYETPFSGLHDGGPDALFAGKEDVITGVFDTLQTMQPKTG